MNDKELADKIVACGVGREPNAAMYSVPGEEDDWPMVYSTAKEFVCDWRVAGACLQNWPTTINVEHLEITLDEMLRDPRAIIEAYVEAHV